MSDWINELLAVTTVEFISGRWFHCGSTWRQETRVLPESMWYWLARGRCFCRLGDDTSEFGAGELFMIPAGCRHEVHPIASRPVETITVHFHARYYMSGDIAGLLSLGGVHQDRDGLFREATLAINRELDQRRTGYVWDVENWGRRVLVELIRRRGDSTAAGVEFAKLQRLNEVLNYIEANLESPIRIRRLARIAGVSEVYLRKLFHSCSLESPSTFIIRRRVFRACEQLKNTSLPVKAIAANCGFTDLPFFYRTFKKITSQTPALFRRHPGI